MMLDNAFESAFRKRFALSSAPQGSCLGAVNRANPSLWLFVLILVPGPALAHGEYVLLFPIGTLVASAAVALAACMAGLGPWLILSGALLAVATSIPLWVVPDPLPEPLKYTGTGHFLFGFVPSAASGAAFVWLCWHWKQAHHRA